MCDLCFRGSAICKIIGANTRKYPDIFEEIVKIYVYEELVNGRKLTEIINEDHENVKYLPGHKLPTNVVSISPKDPENLHKSTSFSYHTPYISQIEEIEGTPWSFLFFESILDVKFAYNG